jgi:alkanesulfonate monooxygenase SsuD/methylene tetrahydromethanopterin reductase-like flavin-dependent oxidoreductase (luciferase family)
VETQVKIGLVLPQFVDDVTVPLRVAEHAQACGIEGVFSFDHLWPWQQSAGSSLAQLPLLGAVVARCEQLVAGTLVTRVGVASNDAVVRALSTANELSGGRFIAGIGAGGGDVARSEDVAYGIEHPSRQKRVEMLTDVATRLRSGGVDVWISGRSPGVVGAAVASGALLNVWTNEGETTERAIDGVGVTWATTLDASPPAIEEAVRAAQRIGHEWLVLLVRGISQRPEQTVELVSSVRQTAFRADSRGGH